MDERGKLVLMLLLSILAVVFFLLIGASLFRITSILEAIASFVERILINASA